MRRLLFSLTLLILGLGSALPANSGPLGALSAARAAPASPAMIYVSAGHLWMRPVDGGPAHVIPTPWRMTDSGGQSNQGVDWSPDARRVALDNGDSRLAVVNLANGHITQLFAQRCGQNCVPPVYRWSPDGRFLAIVKPGPKPHDDVATLTVWDSRQGTTRTLLGGVPAYVGSPQWSHDSTRIAVDVGRFDVIKSIYPRVVVTDLTGRMVRLGKGTDESWSPDDRLLAIISPNFCGANTCDENQLIQPSTGGPAVTLIKHITTNFDGLTWAPRPGGYAYDRWLLGAAGHPFRKLAGPHERVSAWQADGSHLAIATYHPYQSDPDALYIATPGGKRVHVYTDGPNQGCGACSKDSYRVVWGRLGTMFAFATPQYPNPKNVIVHARLYLSPMAGGPLTRIPVRESDLMDILAFLNQDQELILHAGRTVYRYVIATHQLIPIVGNVVTGAGTPAIDPTVVPPVQL